MIISGRAPNYLNFDIKSLSYCNSHLSLICIGPLLIELRMHSHNFSTTTKKTTFFFCNILPYKLKFVSKCNISSRLLEFLFKKSHVGIILCHLITWKSFHLSDFHFFLGYQIMASIIFKLWGKVFKKPFFLNYFYQNNLGVWNSIV